MHVSPAPCDFPEEASENFEATLRFEDKSTGETLSLSVPAADSDNTDGDFTNPYKHMQTTRFCSYCKGNEECYNSLLRLQTFSTPSASIQLSAQATTDGVPVDVTAEAATSVIHSQTFQNCYDPSDITLMLYSDKYSVSLRTPAEVTCRRPSMTEKVVCRVALYNSQNMGLATLIHYQMKYDNNYDIKDGIQVFTCGSPSALSQEQYLTDVAKASGVPETSGASETSTETTTTSSESDTMQIMNSVDGATCKAAINSLVLSEDADPANLNAFFSALFLDDKGEVIDSVRVTTQNVVLACHSRLQLYLQRSGVCFQMAPSDTVSNCQYSKPEERHIRMYLIHNEGGSVDQQKNPLSFGEFYDTVEFDTTTKVCFSCSINWIQNEKYYGGNSCSKQIRNLKKYYATGRLISYVAIDGISWLVDSVYDSNYLPYYITVGILAGVSTIPMLIWAIISLVSIKCRKGFSQQTKAQQGGEVEEDGPTTIGGEGGFQSVIEQASGAGPDL